MGTSTWLIGVVKALGLNVRAYHSRKEHRSPHKAFLLRAVVPAAPFWVPCQFSILLFDVG